MNLQKRIELLQNLKNYLLKNDGTEWQEIKAKTAVHNGWFTTDFIDLAVKISALHFYKQKN